MSTSLTLHSKPRDLFDLQLVHAAGSAATPAEVITLHCIIMKPVYSFSVQTTLEYGT